jgi:hypothetical protein
MHDFVQAEKRKGGRLSLLVPEGVAPPGGCQNCHGGRLFVGLIVGGPHDSAPPFSKMGVPWVKPGEGNTKGETPVTATFDEGKWYQRITRAFRCPLCQVSVADDAFEAAFEEPRSGRLTSIGDVAQKLRGF